MHEAISDNDDRLLADAQFLSSRVSKIDGSGDLGEHIVKVVQAKTVLNNAPPPSRTSLENAAANSTFEAKESTERDGAKPPEAPVKQEDAKT